jgi:hypothetical protein
VDKELAEAVLRRFDDIICVIAGGVAETFPTVTEVEDAEQDARLLVLSYAGLVPGGRHEGTLTTIEREGEYDEIRIKRILATQLKLDLSQNYGRILHRRVPVMSSEILPEQLHPSYTMEDVILGHLDADQLRLDFPYLTARYLDGLTERQIAENQGVHRNTVSNRVAKERDVFLVNFLKSRGVNVVGDETAEELLEAYGYLKAAGR